MFLLYVPIYARQQFFIQLAATLTTLCHIKRNHPVHIIMFKMSTIGRNAGAQTFAKVVDSFVDRCLWQVIPDLLQCIFTARCTLVLSAVLRSHVVCLSVCPSVRLSVCPSVALVDQDHIGRKSWKLIARTLSLSHSLFVAQRPSTYSQGNMGKFWGD